MCSAVTSSRLQSLQFVCLCLPNATRTTWESLITQRQMKSRQTIRRENKINNNHQAGSLVRFSSLHSSFSTVSLTGWMEMILSSQRWPPSFATVITELTADWHPSHCMDGLPLRSLSGNETHWNPVVLNFLFLCLFRHFWNGRPNISVYFMPWTALCLELCVVAMRWTCNSSRKYLTSAQ